MTDSPSAVGLTEQEKWVDTERMHELLHAALPPRGGGERWPAAMVGVVEKQIRGSGGSLEPPGPLLTHPHTVNMA
jgi:hypothetical protein